MSIAEWTRVELIRAGARKQADIEIHFFKAPWISEEDVKHKITIAINRLRPFGLYAVSDLASVTFIGHPGRYVYKSELWSSGTPFPWGIIVGLIAGIIIAGVVIYYVRVIPLRETIKEFNKLLQQIREEVEKSDLPPEQKAKITELINKGEAKGKQTLQQTIEAEYLPTLPKELTELFKYIPYIIGILIVLEVIRAIRR
jgi:hypothetical protein